MSRFHTSILRCLAVGGLVCAAATSANAQSWDDDGIVRISDTAPQNLSPIPEGGAVPQSDCPNCPQHGTTYYDGTPVHNCHGSKCRGGAVHKFLDWFNIHGGACTRSPGYGFSPPVKRPIYRTPVTYRKNFPDAWTGGVAPGGVSGGAPVVYMPTDTTQLGYYYQAVPYWQPVPGAVPPIPRPNEWHTPVSAVQFDSRHPAGKVWGTAPTVPATPEVRYESAAPMPIETLPAEAVPTEAKGLERSAYQPALLPIQ